MRGIYTPVTQIRRQVFAEIARVAFEGEPVSSLEEIPYRIIPGEVPAYRDSVFKERAIIGERVRLGLGLPVRGAGEQGTSPETWTLPTSTRSFTRVLWSMSSPLPATPVR